MLGWFQEKFGRFSVGHFSGFFNQICSVFSTIGFWRLIGIAAISVCKRQWDFQVGFPMPVFSMPKTNWDALISYQIYRLMGHRMRHICTWRFSAWLLHVSFLVSSIWRHSHRLRKFLLPCRKSSRIKNISCKKARREDITGPAWPPMTAWSNRWFRIRDILTSPKMTSIYGYYAEPHIGIYTYYFDWIKFGMKKSRGVFFGCRPFPLWDSCLDTCNTPLIQFQTPDRSWFYWILALEEWFANGVIRDPFFPTDHWSKTWIICSFFFWGGGCGHNMIDGQNPASLDIVMKIPRDEIQVHLSDLIISMISKGFKSKVEM